MLDFLCPTEIDPVQDQTNYHEKLTENTAIWFRREPKFLEWTRAGSGLLWIHGTSMPIHLVPTNDIQWVLESQF